MKKFYLIALFALVCNFAMAQIEQTAYRGAFAPAPAAMWTDTWTNWDPQNEAYPDKSPAATDVSPANSNVVNVTTDITVNTTWKATKTYYLRSLIYVRNNATLTIEPGTVIKGATTSAGTALVITRGSKINAIGTAAAPIVFTSSKTVGNRQSGDWGGLVILGNARFNQNGQVNNIEGISQTVNTEYGGGTRTDDNDNSGTLKYIRIEFAGFVFSPNNELNGITFGAVGKATTVDYIQVSHAYDDSFEWFGGSVNCKHLVAYRGLDDDFDTDNGYKGVVQFALGIKDPAFADNPAVSTSEGFESDNNPGGTASVDGLDNTSAIFSNCTLIGPAKRVALFGGSYATGHARALRLRRETQLKVFNSIFMDFKQNYLFIDGSGTVSNATVDFTLKFKNNIFAGLSTSDFTAFPNGLSAAGVGNNTVANTWMTNSNNSTYASSTDILIQPYGATNTYSNLDYRPGTLASTGADFTDSSMATFLSTPIVVVGTTPLVSNVTYCKGSLASQLTATLTTTGVSLKWYTAATGGIASSTAPMALTTTVGTKDYWVSQVNSSNVESARVKISVIVNALPTEVISTITGQGPITIPAVDATPAVRASATAVGPYIGTSTEFTYSVNTFADSSLTYLWSVPNGVNIVSGQGTNTLTVNYLNIAPGNATSVGSINVQAVNTSGCKTLAKVLAITKALPAAPSAIKMTDASMTVPVSGVATAVTSYAKYMGSTTPLTLTATAVAAASSYVWELPAGVSISSGTVGSSYVRYFTAEPFNAPLTSQPAPATGSKFWKVTYVPITQTIGTGTTVVTTSTATQHIMGADYTYTFTITAGSTANVNDLFTYNGNTYKVSTALISTATSLVCKQNTTTALGTYPTAPSTTVSGTLVKVSDSSTIAFTKIVKAGYDATTSQAYAPYGTVITSDINSILVNFAGVTSSSTTALYLGVKAKNGVGVSVTSNVANVDAVASVATPANAIPGLYDRTYSEVFTVINPSTLTNGISVITADGYVLKTAKLLKISAAIPLSPAALKMTNDAVSTTTAVTAISTFVGTPTSFKLTATPSLAASSYEWELPSGVVRTDGNGTISVSNQITVNFSGVEAGTTYLYIGVKAKNNIGVSNTITNGTLLPATTSTARLLKLTAAVPVAPTTLVMTNPAINATAVTTIGAFIGSTTPLTLTAAASLLATSYEWELPTGVSAVNGSDLTSRTIQVEFSNFPATASTFYVGVKAKNGVGVSVTSNAILVPATFSTAKLLKLTAALPAVVATVAGQIALVNCGQSYEYIITAPAGAASYLVTAPAGSVITSLNNQNNATNTLTTSDLTFSVVYPVIVTTDNKLTVRSNNLVGSCATFKSLTLTRGAACPRIVSNNTIDEMSKVTVTEMYPNPTSDSFNVELSSAKANEISVAVYSFDGMVVSSKNFQLSEGNNVINENLSSQRNGIYVVRIVNSSTGEVIIKKIVKQ
ncbi:Secretion system C-terminal sorting domain [Flavobacteriaceae bacterium]